MSVADNIPQVKFALQEFKLQFDSAMGRAADEISKQLAGTAMRQIKGDRKNVPYPATSGQPPMNVSGDLRRSIRGQSRRKGFGIYEAEAGAYMVYARAVEFGGAPTWRNGQNFPYMRPALEQFRNTDIIRRTIAKYIRSIT